MFHSTPSIDDKWRFSGHQTFPLRYGWLKKVYDAVRACKSKGEDTKTVFHADEAIACFGVGKNMVESMRYWALAAGIIGEARTRPYTKQLGQELLDDEGWDPWMEDANTLWLVHWHFASSPKWTSTWYWVFNHCPYASFARELVVEDLARLCNASDVKKFALTTLRRDVECFVRTYTEKPGAVSTEESLECPLAELSLLQVSKRGQEYQLVRGPKPTLSAALFAFATVEFWQREYANVQTLAFTALFYAPGSPGRVFLLDEESLVTLAMEMEATTKGAITWSETAGLRQLISHRVLTEIKPIEFLPPAFTDTQGGVAI